MLMLGKILVLIGLFLLGNGAAFAAPSASPCTGTTREACAAIAAEEEAYAALERLQDEYREAATRAREERATTRRELDLFIAEPAVDEARLAREALESFALVRNKERLADELLVRVKLLEWRYYEAKGRRDALRRTPRTP